MNDFAPSRARLDLTVESARERLSRRITPLPAQSFSLLESVGLVLAEDITAPIDLPRFTNSAMDGIALHAQVTAGASPEHRVELMLVGTIDAGTVWNDPTKPNQAFAIGTGAPLPTGCDTVIPIELVDDRDGLIVITAPVAKGANVRFKGEDIRQGTRAISSGSILRAQEIGLLAALGIETAQAHPRPAISILSTGLELMDAPGNSRINDANGPMLAALAKAAGAEVVHIDRSDGDLGDLFDRLNDYAHDSDLVITSGGISNSLADTVTELLEPHPQAELWDVHLRPGKHFGFARFDDFVLLALPGNPVAAFVGFELFARSAIDLLAGRPADRPRMMARAGERIVGTLGRTDAVRGRSWIDATGQMWVAPTVNRGSGVLSSLPEANCLILVPEAIDAVAPGETVSIQLIAHH